MRDVHLVLSGSGLKLFAFPRAVMELHRAGHRFTRVTGTSGGAMVGALLASRYDPDASDVDREAAIRHVIDTAMSIDIPAHLDPRWLIWRLVNRTGGLIKGQRLLRLFRRHLPATFAELCMPCEVVAFQVNMADPRTRVITDGDLPLAVRASMSIPFVFDPVWYNRALLVDGGWQMNLALPRGGRDVVALTFEKGDDDSRAPVLNNLELGLRLVDGAIDEGMRRAVDAAPEADVIVIDTDLRGMNFFMTDQEKVKGMDDGAASVRRWLEEKTAP